MNLKKGISEYLSHFYIIFFAVTDYNIGIFLQDNLLNTKSSFQMTEKYNAIQTKLAHCGKVISTPVGKIFSVIIRRCLGLFELCLCILWGLPGE